MPRDSRPTMSSAPAEGSSSLEAAPSRRTSRTGSGSTRWFEGEDGGDPATTAAKADALRAMAFFTGVRVHTENVKGWGFYVQFDLGLSHLDDVKHSVTQANTARGVERSLEGGGDVYLGFGFGVTFSVAERWNMNLGLETRRYGTLQGNAAPGRILPTDDVDVVTGGLSLGFTYRF